MYRNVLALGSTADDMNSSSAKHMSAYAEAGVDIDAANSAVDQMKRHIALTRLPGVLSSAAGNFGGMFSLGGAISGMREPVLVSSIDGVGTKLKLAFLTGRHRSVAADLVNHCVNDILVQGASPLLFLDYFATGKLEEGVAVDVVAGLSDACREAGCVLIGGETAEMPGMYAAGEYDLAGCVVGLVDREHIVDGSAVQEGDMLIGLPSLGLHTNGYSLARHVLFKQSPVDLESVVPGDNVTYVDALLAPHKCYSGSILPILRQAPGTIKAMSHITGGGLLENIPRSLPEGLGAQIDMGSWHILPIFADIQSRGGIDDHEMFRVFNMGIGFVLVVSRHDMPELVTFLEDSGDSSVQIGTVTASKGVQLV